MISPEKAAIYIRWSTEDQGEGTTLDVQLAGCRHYLLSQGWRFREELVFIDDGYSGATLDRPALSRLRALVRAGEVECVVVYKLDRLSRSVADTARLCMDEWDGICYVKSAREPIDTTSQAGKMFFYTLMNYAEWERAVIRERTHAGRVRRAQEGRDPGITIPYGYAKDQGAFVVVPHEAAVVKRIFEAYRLGAGLLRVADMLNGEGLPFRGGRKWQVQTVGYILSNRAYVGELVWGQRMRNPRYGKRSGERSREVRAEPLVRAEGVYPPIISREEFNLIQRIRRERPCRKRGSGGRSMGSAYLLSGLLRCGLCGAAMVGRHNDPRSPRGYYYFCRTRHDKGRLACGARAIQCHALDGEVAEQLMSLYRSEAARHQCMATLAAETAGKLDQTRAELREAERRLALAEERERRVAREYSAGRITLEEFRLLRETLRAEIAALCATAERLAGRRGALEAAQGDRAALAEQASRLQLWEALTVPQRKHLLRQFAGAIRAVKDGEGLTCDITWKVASEGIIHRCVEEEYPVRSPER